MLIENNYIPTVNEVFEDWLTNGIFYILTENYDVPWKNVVDGNTLDLDYHGNRSGEKCVSPLIQKIMVDYKLTYVQKLSIAQLIFSKYQTPWQKAWDVMLEEYNPIDNYKRTHSETYEDNDENSRTINSQKNGTDTGTVNDQNSGNVVTTETGTITTTDENTQDGNTDNKIFGFNSASGSDSDSSTSHQTGSSTTTQTPNTNQNVADSRLMTSTRDLKNSESIEETNKETLKKNGTRTMLTEGNIGVTTSQQMIESELKLRYNYNIFKTFFRDVDKILTNNIFKKQKKECYYV